MGNGVVGTHLPECPKCGVAFAGPECGCEAAFGAAQQSLRGLTLTNEQAVVLIELVNQGRRPSRYTREWYEANLFADQLIGNVATANEAIKAFESGDREAIGAFKEEVEVMRSAIVGAKARWVSRPSQIGEK